MVDSCIISFNLNCIMLLKQFFDIAIKVSSRKKCYYFWWSTWLLMWRHCNYYCCYRNLLRDHCESCFRLALGFRVYIICCLFHCFFYAEMQMVDKLHHYTLHILMYWSIISLQQPGCSVGYSMGHAISISCKHLNVGSRKAHQQYIKVIQSYIVW